MFEKAVEKIRDIAFRNNKEIYEKLVEKDEMKNLLSSMKRPFYLSIVFSAFTIAILLQAFDDTRETFLGFVLFLVWLFLFNGTFACAFINLKDHEIYCKNMKHIEVIKKQVDLNTLKNQHLSLEDLKTLKEELEFIKNDLSEDELFKVLKITKTRLKREVGDLSFFEYLFRHYQGIRKQALIVDEKKCESEDLIHLFNLFQKASQ